MHDAQMQRQGAMWPVAEEAGVPHATATLYMLVLIPVPCVGPQGQQASLSPSLLKPQSLSL